MSRSSNRLSQFKTWFAGFRQRWRQEIWASELPPVASLKGLVYRFGRMVNIVAQGFREDALRMHASSLTYSTLMSLLPILAIALAIAKGLGQDQKARDFLLDYTADMPQEFQSFVENLLLIVTQTDFAQLGAIGALFLLFMVIQVLTTIEGSFNHLWGVEKPREMSRRITNYVTIVVVLPVLLLAGFSAIAQFNSGDHWLQHLGLFRLLPFVATWLAFSFLYYSMPNTKVRWVPSIVGGFAGALFWQGWLEFYAFAQPGVTRYNVLYGALASIPIFLIWLNVSWLLVLTGAKVTFAVQNGASYRNFAGGDRANAEVRLALALSVLQAAAKSLEKGTPSFSRAQGLSLAKHPHLLEDTLAFLKRSALLVETSEPGEYVLRRSPQSIMVAEVGQAFFRDGEDLSKLGITEVDPKLQAIVSQFGKPWHDRLTLADLIDDPLQARDEERETPLSA